MMPEINLEKVREIVTEEEAALVQGIIATQGKNRGRLRAAKPKVTDRDSGRVAYLWRMVAFGISPKSQHQCMPVCADFDLEEGGREQRREVSKWLDGLATTVESTVPLRERHGTLRWGRALGYL